jgi:hypothetical protein
MEEQPLPRWLRATELAARRYGTITVEQLAAFGIGRASIEKALGNGRLRRLHHGVYAMGHTDLPLHGRCLAAVSACGPGALLSHYSAAWLWDLLSTQPIPVHVTTPIPRKHRTLVVIHHSRTLIEEDQAVQEGIPATSIPRTLLDLAPLVRLSQLRRALKRSEELKLFDLPVVLSLLDRNKGHRGNKPLRRALAIYEPPRFTRSGTEDYFVSLVEAAGLPRPVTNWVEAGHELDVYWPELRFAVEIDVFETHGTRQSFEDDRLRDEDLKLAGIETTRVTGRRLEREPRRVLDRVGRLLEQRRRHLA